MSGISLVASPGLTSQKQSWLVMYLTSILYCVKRSYLNRGVISVIFFSYAIMTLGIAGWRGVGLLEVPFSWTGGYFPALIHLLKKSGYDVNTYQKIFCWYQLLSNECLGFVSPWVLWFHQPWTRKWGYPWPREGEPGFFVWWKVERSINLQKNNVLLSSQNPKESSSVPIWCVICTFSQSGLLLLFYIIINPFSFFLFFPQV